jgi:phosphatidylserine/phosphatidylglycerophosphate/cardiolipin synthase-like enzyme
MHLKEYVVDGETLRSGSANFSRGGEVYQDNDLVIVRDRSAAAKFEAHFERMWASAQKVEDFEPAVRAFEPK